MKQHLTALPKWYLSIKKCETIYKKFSRAISFHQPLPPFEHRYPHRLESILSSVEQSFDGHQFYPTVGDAASAYYFKLCCKHPFMNGNKRLGILFTHVFLLQNGVDFSLGWEDLYSLTENIAKMSEEGYSEKDVERLCKKAIEDFTIPHNF